MKRMRRLLWVFAVVTLLLSFASVESPAQEISAADQTITADESGNSQEQSKGETEENAGGAAADNGDTQPGKDEQTEEKPGKSRKKKKVGNCDAYIGLAKKYYVLATAKKTVKVYKKKSADSKVLGKFTKNNCIVVNTKKMKKGKNYKWLKVNLQNGKTGYIKYKLVKLDKLDVKNFGLKKTSRKNRQRISICRYGIPYLGTRYVLGGNSLTNGIDCSIFARRAMRNAGVMVSRYSLARTLARYGKGIRRSQLKPGDMVFYQNSSKDRTIGHCAIYLGRGYIINASGHQGKVYPGGGMRISKIDYRKPTACIFRNLVGN